MATSMKEIGGWTEPMAMADTRTLMALLTRASGSRTQSPAKDMRHGQMEAPMRESFEVDANMEWALTHQVVVLCIRACSKTTRCMEKVTTNSRMAAHMLDSGHLDK